MSYLNKMTINDLDFAGHRVLVRVDYNIPIENGIIRDDRRIRATLPTLKKVLEGRGIPILMSHLGRPDGQRVESLSLEPVAVRLSELLGKPVSFANDCIGEESKKMRDMAKVGDIILLENLRFHTEEEENDPDFAKKLAGHADIYINDAFGTCHRAHASMVGVPKFMKYSVAGYLLMRELEMIDNLIENPLRPFIAVIGGSKVSSKIGIIENLLDHCDKILVGGAMANTFFESLGISQGSSLVEHEKLEQARKTLEKADAHKGIGGTIYLPIDSVVTDKISEDGIKRVAAYDQMPSNLMVADIGPDTIARYCHELKNANTIIMNGPVGVFELDKFSHGTKEILKVLAERHEAGAKVVVGGGDSAAAVKKFGLEENMSHISTGGGASLKLMEGKSLPAVDALTDK